MTHVMPDQEAPSQCTASEIEIRGMTMKYGENVAVRALDLDIQRSEMLVLLGPSGCGKTSTMRSIVGLETPTAGTIRVSGKTVFDSASGINVPPNRRGIGMVFQSYAIWPHKDVFENVAFPLRMQRLSRTEITERVHDTLERVGLSGMARRGASLLSGGQMQRVALARSLVMRPRVLLLDEPLSNLDAKLRDRLRFELKELQQDIGVTSIYVTHDQSEALALADRIAVMQAGEIVQLDDPRACYDRPANRFVADFLGVTNTFPGAVVPSGAGEVRMILEGTRAEVIVESALSATDDATLCLRPDVISLVGAGTGSGPNVWPAHVRAASFLGTHVRYQVETDSGLELDVVAFSRASMFAAHDRVDVVVQPADARIVTE